MTAPKHNLLQFPEIEPLKSVASPADEITRLKKLYELSMTLSGNPMEVFELAARMIGQLLDVKVVCLSELRDDQLYFLSVYANGKIHSNSGTCDLSITPCATVEQTKDYRVYDRVMERFPEASFLKDHNAYSYCGFPALGSDGQVLAVTCLLDDRPRNFTEADHDMLRIFGQRIAMEIERQRQLAAQEEIEEELRHHREHLEELVAARTEELRTAEQELVRSERLAALGQITATVSHELRNPLGSIRPSLHYLRKNAAGLDEKSVMALDRIERSVTRCDHIIDELLDFSRTRPLALQYLPVDHWLDDILAEQPKPKNIALIRKQHIGDPVVAVDPDLMTRVVINIYENACQALLDRQAKAGEDYQPQLTITTSIEATKVALRFADNGSGIDDSIRDRIFEPMFSTKSFGVGLGLPIVKRIVETHGGEIEITSRVDEGTTVTLWIPTGS
ncbi:MAG: ATP-binding protein [Gammaproteobacteria bacterium]|nr:ATP-binding protein [Gammaproteobacteria bacterium]